MSSSDSVALPGWTTSRAIESRITEPAREARLGSTDKAGARVAATVSPIPSTRDLTAAAAGPGTPGDGGAVSTTSTAPESIVGTSCLARPFEPGGRNRPIADRPGDSAVEPRRMPVRGATDGGHSHGSVAHDDDRR